MVPAAVPNFRDTVVLGSCLARARPDLHGGADDRPGGAARAVCAPAREEGLWSDRSALPLALLRSRTFLDQILWNHEGMSRSDAVRSMA